MKGYWVTLDLDGKPIRCRVLVQIRFGMYIVEDVYGTVDGVWHHLNFKLYFKAQEYFDQKRKPI